MRLSRLLHSRLLWPSIATFIVFFILVSLGSWQLRRLAWKEALIAQAETGISAEPVDLPKPETWAGLDPNQYSYRKVRITGHFLHDKELHVFFALNRPRGQYGGLGYFIVTALQQADGSIVFINRGFVPKEKKAPETRLEGQIKGQTTFVGLMRPPEERSWITPSDDYQRNEWFVRNASDFAKNLGLSKGKIAPFTIDAVAAQNAGTLPQGGETRLTFPNNHLQYAVTWYGLALALLAVFGAFAWKQLHLPNQRHLH